jgi:hypothetical protein
MEKLDLKRQLKHLYLPSAKSVTALDVPAMNFLMSDGRLEPEATPGTSASFSEAVGSLYALSYTLKFMSKRREVDPIDYTVMALEGLWDLPMSGVDYSDSGEWSWTLMMMQPGHINREMFNEAQAQVQEKHEKDGRATEAIGRVRFEPFHEGLCLQIMHVGPYADEPRSIAKLEDYARDNGYSFRGRHHEIYLGDPRTARPENLRTVLRHAVVATG